MSFSPLLAARADLSHVRFPLLASPKIDGIRAIVRDGVVWARSGKPIPNAHIQRMFGRLHGLDGELVIGSPTAADAFRAAQSGVMSAGGEPDARYLVFDRWDTAERPFSERHAALLELREAGELPAGAELVEQRMLRSEREIEAFERECLEAGYEGAMLRRPDAPYKFGRSTTREGILLKLKRFADAEAVVEDMEELTRGGRTARGLLGALHVRDLKSGARFSIGTGFSEAERSRLWRMGRALAGRLVSYRYFPHGGKERPRHPIFAGLRSPLDMEARHASV